MKGFLRLFIKQIKFDIKWSFVFFFLAVFSSFSFLLIHGFRVSVESELKEKLTASLGADLVISHRSLFSKEQDQIILSHSKPIQTARATEFFSMAQFNSSSRLALVRAVTPEFPLKSNFILKSGNTFKLFSDANFVYISQELELLLGVRIGDTLSLGGELFIVKDIIIKDPTQTFRLGSLAPRVYISRSKILNSSLLGLGTNLTDIFYVNLKSLNERDKIQSELLKKLPDPSIDVLTPQTFSNQMSRPITLMGDFLSLLSLGSLLLTHIGLFYLCRLFFVKRLSSLTLLEILGYSRNHNIWLTFCELFFLLLFGSLLGSAFAILILPQLDIFFPKDLNLTIKTQTLFWPFIFSNLSILLIPISFYLPHVLNLNLSKGFQALNDGLEYQNSFSNKSLLIFGVSPLFIFFLSFYISPSWKIISTYYLGLSLFIVFTLFFSRILFLIFSKLSSGFFAQLVFKRITRAPFHFGIITSTLALCTSFVSLLIFVSFAFIKEIESPNDKRPTLFIFDIQDEDINNLNSFLLNNNLSPLNLSPLIRARILKINGIPFERDSSSAPLTREAESEVRIRNRGVNLTIRDHITSSEKIIAGKSFSELKNKEPVHFLSIEERYAKRMNIQLNDILDLEIQGLEFKIKVGQIRKVKWNSFLPNFFIQLPSGVIDEAPKTWLLGLQTENSIQKVDLQNKIVKNFPSLSVLDIESTIQQLVQWSEDFVRIMVSASLLQFLMGVFVVIFLILIEFKTRSKEFFLYPFLGFKKIHIRKLILIELTTLIGISLFLGVSYAFLFSKILFHLVFQS